MRYAYRCSLCEGTRYPEDIGKHLAWHIYGHEEIDNEDPQAKRPESVEFTLVRIPTDPETP